MHIMVVLLYIFWRKYYGIKSKRVRPWYHKTKCQGWVLLINGCTLKSTDHDYILESSAGEVKSLIR